MFKYKSTFLNSQVQIWKLKIQKLRKVRRNNLNQNLNNHITFKNKFKIIKSSFKNQEVKKKLQADRLAKF